jgi:hypothetical protein
MSFCARGKVLGKRAPHSFTIPHKTLSVVGVSNRFVARLSKISHPIPFLQKKGIKFEWTTKCEENFNLLKELLTSAPILKIVDPNEIFLVCTDACKEGISGFLT